MAIFDGIGDLIPAPDDKGNYNEKENDINIIPLPKSIVPPKEKYIDPVLPSDKLEESNYDQEILDEGEYFPESNNNLTPAKENLNLPIGVDISPELEDLLFPVGVIVPEIVDDLSTPTGDSIPVIDDSKLKLNPIGPNTKTAPDKVPVLPTSATINSSVNSTIINAPKDVNLYLDFKDDNSFLNTGVVKSPKGINYSDTIVDRLFTKVNDVLDFIRVPVPESIISLYSKIQEIEGYLSDPKSFAIQVRDKAIGFLLGKSSGDSLDPNIGLVLAPKSILEKVENINWNSSSSKAEMARYDDLNGIYAGQTQLTEGYVDTERSKQISDAIIESQFAFQGRKSTVGVTMRLNHLWDLKFEKYEAPGINCVIPDMHVRESTSYKNASDGRSSEDYLEKDLRKEIWGGKVISDWEDTLPVLSYDLDYLSLASREVELYGGSTISIPEIIKRNSLLTVQVLDDENKRWRRWFQRVLDAMCPPKNKGDSAASNSSIVTPYKNCCMKATLFQYRTDSHILSYKVFIVILKNYQVTSSGAGGGAGSPDIIDVEWSIVGEIESGKSVREKKYSNRSQRSKKYPKDNSLSSIEEAENKEYSGKYINIV